MLYHRLDLHRQTANLIPPVPSGPLQAFHLGGFFYFPPPLRPLLNAYHQGRAIIRGSLRAVGDKVGSQFLRAAA